MGVVCNRFFPLKGLRKSYGRLSYTDVVNWALNHVLRWGTNRIVCFFCGIVYFWKIGAGFRHRPGGNPKWSLKILLKWLRLEYPTE